MELVGRPARATGSKAAASPQTTRRIGGLAWQVLLLALLALLAGALAYQAPPAGRVAIGWLGDQLFLDSSGGLGQDAVERGEFYIDDLTPDSPTGRSRWTREQAQIALPNLGAGADLQLTLLVQGWPTDVIGTATTQPEVTVYADGTEIGRFRPTPEWAEYRFSVPAEVREGADLTLRLHASATFSDTERGADARPKGLRLAEVRVAPERDDPTELVLVAPAWPAVGLLTLAVLLFYAVLLRLRARAQFAFVATVALTGGAAIGLAAARIWMGTTLTVGLGLLAGALLLLFYKPLLDLLRALVRRYNQGRALSYGLVTAGLAGLGYALIRLSEAVQLPGVEVFWQLFPDSLLYVLLAVGLLALTFVLGREGLPKLSNGIVAWLERRSVALILLLLFGAVWLGYSAWMIAQLPYVGHADYADNAVVARNLVNGRGWVVDYVSQFYQLYDGLTRPQETWPLLQPVWIAPFFAVFGPENWAAKLPNLVFSAILMVLIYHIGTRLWNRRVGLTAAILTLTSHLFFTLTIYATSDLAFVVFVTGALFLVYKIGVTAAKTAEPDNTPPPERSGRLARLAVRFGGLRVNRAETRLLSGAGVLTGLMMLQKPSGAMIALGMGFWLIGMSLGGGAERLSLATLQRRLGPTLARCALWTVVALIVLSPYLVRNMALFGKPVYSTESHDAWVLGYRGDSEEAWNDIYRVFAPELGGPGVPDRSWILRWGFDYTAAKFWTQVDALRDYLMPVWPGLPDSLSHFFSSSERRNILSGLGAWLALIGVIGALRYRRRLVSLLGLAFGVYAVFMLTYWRTNEERYWVMLIPWLALLASWVIWAGYERMAAISDGRWSPLGLLLVGAAIGGIMLPSWPLIADKVEVEPGKWAPDVIAYEWLRENTDPDAVMMTRNPWQLNWHAERAAVMIPNTVDRELFFALARHYDADYLVLENLQRVKSDAARNLAALTKPAAADAQVGDVIEGFTLVYASPTEDDRVFVYRFPDSVAGRQ